MLRINSMKKFLISSVFCLLTLPVLAQTSPAPTSVEAADKKQAAALDPSSLDIDLNQYYRYTNKKCDFSFQLPEAPTSKLLWGEMTLPFEIENMPPYGEVGEHLKYSVRSLDKKNFFDLNAYCLYGRHADYTSIDLAAMETKLQSVVDNHDLRNYKVTTEPVTDEFVVGTMHGLKINEADESVHTYHYQYFKGRNSMLMIEIRYNAEQGEMDKLYKSIQDSLIYGAKN